MKKKIVIGVMIILIIIVLIVINPQNWNLQSCQKECIHRSYDSGNCMWPLEISGDEINIGSCLIFQSKHCGNKGQCNCYCEYGKLIGGERDEYGCLGSAGYSWNETEQSCVREWLQGEERYQVINFYTCEAAGYPVMESYPRQCSSRNQTWIEEIESKDCEVDLDCVVFGKTGDCSCGCYNKDALPQESEEGCFCAAPKSCECIDGTCEGIFE